MDCRQYQDALKAAALGAESGRRARGFRLHLEICEACRNELARRREFVGALDRQLQTQLESSPSADFNARLRRRIAEEPNARPAIFNWLPLLAGAAAIAVALVVISVQHRAARNQSDIAPEVATARHDSTHEETPPPASPSEAAQTSPAPENSPSEKSLLHPVMAAGSSRALLKVRVDPQEIYATVRFAQAIAEGRIDARTLLSAAQATNKTDDATALDIPILEVPPLKSPSEEQSGEARDGNSAANN
jgi:anti-sigma factor RsiW